MAAVRSIGSSSGLIRTATELKRENSRALEGCISISRKICNRLPPRRRNSLPEQLREGQSHPVDLARIFKIQSFILEEFLAGLEDIPEFSDKRLKDILEESCDWLANRANWICANQGSAVVAHL